MENEWILHIAACDGEVELAEKVLKEGADINSIDHLGQTVLMKAAIRGNFVMCQIFLE